MSCELCRGANADLDRCDVAGTQVICRRCKRVLSDSNDFAKSNRDLLREGKVGVLGYLGALLFRGEG